MPLLALNETVTLVEAEEAVEAAAVVRAVVVGLVIAVAVEATVADVEAALTVGDLETSRVRRRPFKGMAELCHPSCRTKWTKVRFTCLSTSHWRTRQLLTRYFDRWLVASTLWALWVVGSKLYSSTGDVGFEITSSEVVQLVGFCILNQWAIPVGLTSINTVGFELRSRQEPSYTPFGYLEGDRASCGLLWLLWASEGFIKSFLSISTIRCISPSSFVYSLGLPGTPVTLALSVFLADEFGCNTRTRLR
jgi:hypothetical protein